MAYVGVFTDTNNQISFDVMQVPSQDNPDKYLEFAKFVTNPYEKTEILRALSPLCLSDYYMIFTLMDGELWTPLTQDPIQEYITNLIIENLNIDTIDEEPEISEPD